MNPKYATPFSTYKGGSNFELPDGNVIVITDVVTKTEKIGQDTYAGVELKGVDESGEERTEFLFAGKTDRVVPEDNHLIPSGEFKGEQFQISSNCPLGIMLESLTHIGYPWNADQWDKEGFTQLVGASLTVLRVPVIDWKTKQPKTRTAKDGKEYPMTNLTFTAWKRDAKGAKSQPASAAAKAATTGAPSADLQTRVSSLIEEALIEGLAAKVEVVKYITSKIDAPLKTDAIRLTNNQEFLTKGSDTWQFSNGTFSLK